MNEMMAMGREATVEQDHARRAEIRQVELALRVLPRYALERAYRERKLGDPEERTTVQLMDDLLAAQFGLRAVHGYFHRML